MNHTIENHAERIKMYAAYLAIEGQRPHPNEWLVHSYIDGVESHTRMLANTILSRDILEGK